MTYLELFGIFVWLLIGWASFIYWWTTEFAYTKAEAWTSIFASILGPIGFIVGRRIHKRK